MRILTVGNMYPPHHLGGYELVWRSAVEHLRRAGHQVRVLTTDHREAGIDSADDPDVHRVLGWYWRDHRFPRMSMYQRLVLERRNGAILDRHLEEFQPDAVGWWAMGGMSLSLIERVRRRAVPAVGFVCDDWMVYGPRVDAWMRAFRRPGLAQVVERLTAVPTHLDLGSVGAWVFPSESVRQTALRHWNLPVTIVVHQGVDHSLFRPEPRPSWGWRMAYVGRIDPRKGLDLAIRSLRHLPETSTLKIVGSGDAAYLEELQQLSRDAGLAPRVEFVGQLAREALPAIYARADVVVFPVLWEEPWGLVPLEAMAVGAPVVASGRGGSAEYLQEESNCLVFDADQGPEAIASAVARLAASEDLRARLRDVGFRTTASMSEKDFDEAVESALLRAVTREG